MRRICISKRGELEKVKKDFFLVFLAFKTAELSLFLDFFLPRCGLALELNALMEKFGFSASERKKLSFPAERRKEKS